MRRSFTAILALCILCLTMANCSEPDVAGPEDISETAGVRSSVGPAKVGGTSPKYFVSTVADLDTLLALEAGPDIADGDTIVITANLTLNGKSYTIQDKGIVFIGDKSGAAPVLSKDATQPSGPLFDFEDETQVDRSDCQFVNIDFSVEGASSPVVRLLKVRSVVLRNIDATGGTSFQIQSDSVVVDSCTFSGQGAQLVKISARAWEAFAHKISDCDFNGTSTTEPDRCLELWQSNSSGTFEVSDCKFTYTTSGSRQAIYTSVQEADDGSSHEVTLKLERNDFGDGVLHVHDPVVDSTELTFDIVYDDNNSDVARCVEDTYTSNYNNAEIDWDIRTYEYLDSLYGYTGFSQITEIADCYNDSLDAAYVRFDCDSVGYNYLYEEGYVYWGDDGCTDDTVQVYKNSKDQFVAELDLSGIGDTDYYWLGAITFCGKTVSMSCRRASMRTSGPVPPWFEEEPGEDGGGEKEEEEQTEEEEE